MLALKRIALIGLLVVLAACQSDEDRSQDAYERGLELLEDGDAERARIEFRNAVRIYNLNLPAHLELGRLLMADGATRPAFRSFRIVVENEPDNAEALLALSQISFLNNDWEAFERYAPRAIAALPDQIETNILDVATRYRQAVIDDQQTVRSQILVEATELGTQAPDDRLLRRLLIDGNISEGRFGAALDQIDREIAENPRNRDLYDLKISLLVQLGEFGGIEDELRRMVEIFPKDKEVQQLLLRTLIGRGKSDAAEDYLRERIETAEAGDDEPYVSFIQFLNLQRGADVAMDELETLIAGRPDSHMLRMMRAALNFETGKSDLAIAEVEEVIAEEAGTETYTLADQLSYKAALAKMLRDSGNEVGARRLVEEILEQAPNDVEALKMQARWLIEEENTNAAITALRTAISETPDDAEALTIMAWAYERSGDTQLTLDFLSLAVEASNNGPQEALRYATALLAEDRVDQAESVLQTALRVQPTNVDLLSSLGRIYLRQRDIPRARQAEQALRRIDTPQAQAVARGIQLELIALEQGAEQALDFLGNLATANDADNQSKITFIRGLLQSGETARATEFVEGLIAEDPDNDAYRYFEAVMQAANRDFDAAQASLTALTERSPAIVPAWQLLARLQAATGQTEAAVGTLEQALTAVPDSAELMWAKASYLETIDEIDAAIAVYETLYERNSNSIIAANNLASMISTYRDDPENLERARTIARRLKDSEIPAFQDTYGWILHRSGESAEALPYLESAAAALTSDAQVQIHLGYAYLALDQRDAAEAQLERARTIVADPLIGTQIRQRVEAFEAALAEAPVEAPVEAATE